MFVPLDDRFVLAARRVLRRDGPSGLTVSRVAAEAGASRMTLHRHAIGPAELLEALVRRMIDAERLALWPALTAEGDAAARLRMALEAECRVVEEHLEVLEAMDAGMRAAAFHSSEGESRAEFVDPLRRLLEDGRLDGTLAATDPKEDATVLVNLVGPTYRHLRAGHGWTPDRARAAVVRLALDGIRAR